MLHDVAERREAAVVTKTSRRRRRRRKGELIEVQIGELG
jgi:hypothetical protein